MNSKILRDKFGVKLGTLKIRSSGITELRGKHGRLLGTYNPETNKTRDENGKLLGSGNILSVLLIDNY